MIVRNNFHEYLINLLKQKVYVLLNILSKDISNPKEALIYQILLKKEDLEKIVDELQKYSELANIQVFTTFRISKALIELKDNTKIAIEFVHKLVHKSLVYLDEERIMERRVMRENGLNIPSIEDLFEYTILKNFLNNQSLTKEEFEYFEDFHVLVKEDLLEYFNMKYGTSFTNFYQLTDYNSKQRQNIVKNLKTAPTNGFLKKVNVRWHYFMGYMKQARII
jgi:hypothetical protein